jgi:multiple antibiotic resistance protein
MIFATDVLLAFVPLLVAMNPLGKAPVFISLTQAATPAQRNRVMWQALGVSMAICLAFILVGRYVFRFLSIQPADFQIGGGLLLFAFAVADVLNVRRPVPVGDEDVVGVCPLATPLIAGPAVLTTLLLMVDRVHAPATIAALAVNALIMFLVLRSANSLVLRIGRPTMVGLSKVMMILLAAIGVMMVRKGIMFYVNCGAASAAG